MQESGFAMPQKMREDAEKERELSKLATTYEDSEQSEDGDEYMDTDQTCSGSSSNEGDDPTSTRAEIQGKKRRLSSMATLIQPGNEPVSKYQHVCESIR